jgi:benzoate-CoA ligase
LNAAHELIFENLDKRGHRVAVFHSQDSLTYLDLARNVNRFGHLLLGLGLRPRERVAIQLPDRPECLYAFLGCIQAGLWPVLMSPDLGPDASSFILCDAQASAVVTARAPAVAEPGCGRIRELLGGAPTFLPAGSCGGASATWEQADKNVGAPTDPRQLANALPGCPSVRLRLNVDDPACQSAWAAASPELDPYAAHADDIAFLLYSSGSTGQPNGVPHRHRDMLVCADTYGSEVLGITDQDIHFSASKLFFAYGLGNSLFLPFRFGAATVLFPAKPTPADIFRVIATRRPTVFFGVPALYSMLVKTFEAAASLDSLRLCVSAGESLPAVVSQEWRRLTGLDILDGIGSTEALHIFISNRPGRVRPGTSGGVVPGYEARIVTEAGPAAVAGQPGDLLIRGASTAPYYWSRPDKTAATMLPDSWLKTGDIYVEQDGIFTYQGRRDDMFKVDARWVSPVQVEDALREHPAVRECGVTWRRLESLVKPVAHVVLEAGYTAGPGLEKELRLFARARLPDHACPALVRFQEALPRTDTGKIQRFRLREMRPAEALETEPKAGSPGFGRHETTTQNQPMKTTAADMLEVCKQAGIQQQVLDQIKPDAPLLLQGLDSMDLPAIAAATEQRFQIDLSDADGKDLKTINDYVQFVNRKLK